MDRRFDLDLSFLGAGVCGSPLAKLVSCNGLPIDFMCESSFKSMIYGSFLSSFNYISMIYKAEQLNKLYDVLKYNDLMDLPTGLYLVKGATLLTLSQI